MRASRSGISGRSSVTFSKCARGSPMSSKSRTEVACQALGVAVTLVLGGCSDIYFDRRETVALGADDHLAVNRVAQMVDPWPYHVDNKNIAFNGDRMQSA